MICPVIMAKQHKNRWQQAGNHAVICGEAVGPQSAKTDLRVNIFENAFLAQNSSLGLLNDAQSENIGE